MVLVLVSLGSNSGDCRAHLDFATAELKKLRRTSWVRESSRRETAPIGGPEDQSLFVNSAALLETRLSPREFFYELQRIEAGAGRMRDVRWGPRTLDLDLLLFGGVELQTTDLQVPHPRSACRRFVLEPAAEIAPEMTHPVNGWSLTRLLVNLDHGPNAISLCGPFAAELQQACAAEVSLPLFVGLRTDVKLLIVVGPDEEAEAFRRLPDAPPSLVLPNDDLAGNRAELLAAIAAME